VDGKRLRQFSTVLGIRTKFSCAKGTSEVSRESAIAVGHGNEVHECSHASNRCSRIALGCPWRSPWSLAWGGPHPSTVWSLHSMLTTIDLRDIVV